MVAACWRLHPRIVVEQVSIVDLFGLFLFLLLSFLLFFAILKFSSLIVVVLEVRILNEANRDESNNDDHQNEPFFTFSLLYTVLMVFVGLGRIVLEELFGAVHLHNVFLGPDTLTVIDLVSSLSWHKPPPHIVTEHCFTVRPSIVGTSILILKVINKTLVLYQ